MFSKLTLVAVASMAVFVSALPRPDGSSSITNSCNGGTVQCCTSYQATSSDAVQQKAKELDLLDAIVPADVTAGLTCTPVSVLTLAGQSCTAQQACCSGNSFDGAIVLGCNPINANV